MSITNEVHWRGVWLTHWWIDISWGILCVIVSLILPVFIYWKLSWAAVEEARRCQPDIRTHSQKLRPNVQLAVRRCCSADNWILFYCQWLWEEMERGSVAISQTQPVPHLPYFIEELRVSVGKWGSGNYRNFSLACQLWLNPPWARHTRWHSNISISHIFTGDTN